MDQRLVLGAAGLLLVLVPWEIFARVGLVRPILTSSPSAVATTFVSEVQRGSLWTDISATLQVWAAGYLLAAVVGISLGLVAGWFKRVSYVADPWLSILFAAPELAFIPIFILWFGLGFTFKVWLVFLAALFYITINTIAGVHATERKYIDVADVFGASKLQIFRTIVLPGSVPYIMTGLRQAAGRALVAVIAAEFVASNEGLGFLITLSGQTLNTARVFVGIVIIAALGIGLGEILGRIEHRFDVWRREAAA